MVSSATISLSRLGTVWGIKLAAQVSGYSTFYSNGWVYKRLEGFATRIVWTNPFSGRGGE